MLEVIFLDHFSVLNYQGSKKNLIDFIHENTKNIISPEKTILDIFAGTCSVGYSYKRTNSVFANDSELYSYIISRALLNSNYSNYSNYSNTVERLLFFYYQNQDKHRSVYKDLGHRENDIINENNNNDNLIELYNVVPTIWDNGDL